MEPQAQLPTPEAVPQPSTPESPEQAVSLEPVEAPAPQETKKPSEGANQNQGQPVQTVPATTPVTTDEPAKTTVKTDDSAGSPAIADDIDVIEKEWVDKAKNIVEKNKQDPHKQNKEVSVLKADYMKKRYGKEIKLTDD